MKYALGWNLRARLLRLCATDAPAPIAPGPPRPEPGCDDRLPPTASSLALLAAKVVTFRGPVQKQSPANASKTASAKVRPGPGVAHLSACALISTGELPSSCMTATAGGCVARRGQPDIRILQALLLAVLCCLSLGDRSLQMGNSPSAMVRHDSTLLSSELIASCLLNRNFESGDHVMIGWNTTLSDSGLLFPVAPANGSRMPLHCRLSPTACCVPARKPVVIGDDVFIGPACTTQRRHDGAACS